MLLRAPFEDLLDSVLPARCPGCGRRGAIVCSSCASRLKAAPAAAPPDPVAWWTACFAYEGVARELVARAKYRNVRRFLVVIAGELAGALDAAPARFDVITWAPASTQRIRAHGVDHGELLARAVGRITRSPVARCLIRAPGPAQTGLDVRARRAGPLLRAMGPGAGATVLVVDDVAPTGGTLAAAARALQGAGTRTVFAATIARTPGPGARRAPAAYTPPTPAGTRAEKSRS